MNQFQHPVVLVGERVKLIPLDNTHFESLVKIATNKQIWQFMSIDGTEKNVLLTFLRSAIMRRAIGDQYPFTVIDNKSGAIIGCTLFHNIFFEHRKLEIGWTWYSPNYWRTGYNRECKLLLLTHCFETLKLTRVQFQTDENNLRSRTAILGIGAKQEGILRNDRIRSDGTLRNSVMFSIIDTEWDDCKDALKNSLSV